MPYTKQELENVDFYTEFVDKLRDRYLNKFIKFSQKSYPFRDENGVLYSFEDILTGTGMEDASLESPLYAHILYEPNLEAMPPDLQQLATELFDLLRASMFTKQTEKLTKYIKGKKLEKIIDRNISELSEDLFIDELPENIVNGDVVTSPKTDDFRKWLIQNNQKRIFPSLGSFFGNGYKAVDIKTVSTSILNSIPDGDPVE